MIEKVGTIKNPLTIIAIFAGIAEISGTVVLPFIAEGNQSTYIWFLMIFPVLLVLLFFLTLNFNHKVLYAPSDFKDEGNFFKSFQPASPIERAEKLKEQAREIEAETATEAEPKEETPTSKEGAVSKEASQRDFRARYSLAEDLVLSKIAKELQAFIRRDMMFITPGRRVQFDGVIVSDEKVTAIEVKYFRSSKSIALRFKEVFYSILDAVERLPDSTRNQFSLVLAVVTDEPVTEHNQLSTQLYSLMRITPFPVEIRVFNLEELEKEFNLAA